MAASAILAISSTDRYITYSGGNANQPTSSVLQNQYEGVGPFSNDFSITAPNALINGYIDTIKISQIQLQYYLPTIVPGGNDLIIVEVETATSSGLYTTYPVTIPYGFYSPSDLANILVIRLNEVVYGDPNSTNFEVAYSNGLVVGGANAGFTGFTVVSNNSRRFLFPNPNTYPVLQQQQILKAYKLYGFNINNSNPQFSQFSYLAPDFLYTPYIDIFSDALTNYQNLKDTDSSTIRRKGLIARIYLSGVGNPQVTTEEVRTISVATGQSIAITSQGAALGSAPFVLTYDMNTPKIIKWTPDSAVNSLDFQLRDCYGDLLFTKLPGQQQEVFNTEFQMTLLCVESRR